MIHVAISVIVPVYNEEKTLESLYTQILQSFHDFDGRFEIIFVNDGSNDCSMDVLTALYHKDSHVVVIHLKRNFGQTAALMAGIEYAQGDIVVMLDADLQNDPGDIPRLIAKLNEGYDVVSGWRNVRQDPYFSRRFPSRVANWLISVVTGVRLRDYGCTLKAYRRVVLEGVELYGEMHRFLPALVAWSGARVTEIPVNHRARQHGVSHYGMGRTVRVVLDLLTVKFLLSYRTRPIQFFGGIGLAFVFLSIVLMALVAIMKLAYSYDVTGNPLFLFSFVSFLVGIQMIVFGLLGELITRVYYRGHQRKTFVVKQIQRIS